MDARALAFGLLAWLITYAIHSTLLLGSAWFVARSAGPARVLLRDRLWKWAVVGAILTSSLQTGLGLRPVMGLWSLEQQVAGPPWKEPVPAVERPRPEPRPALALAHEADLPPRSRPFVPPSVVPTRETRRAPESSPDPEPAAAAPARPAPAAALPPSTDPASPIDWKNGALALWCALSALGLIGIASAWLRLSRRIRAREDVLDPGLHAMLERLRRQSGLARSVRLTQCEALPGPITLGVLRPEICLPPRALHGLSAEQKESMLAHELGHLVRKDPLWFNLLHAIERLFFFQPLNRLARGEVQDTAELLADDLAVGWTGNGLALASCLTEVAGWLVERRQPRLVPGMAQVPSRLVERVERLLAEEQRRSQGGEERWSTPTAALAVGALVLCVPRVASSLPAPVEAVEPIESRAPGHPHEPAVEEAPVQAPIGLGIQVELLDEEIGLLDEEVGGLRHEMHGLDLLERFEDKLDDIEQRMRSLRDRRDLLQRHLIEVLPPDDPALFSLTGP